MWHKLNRIEGTVFFLPFMIYARIKHIPYSTRCSKCGRSIFNQRNCRDRLCERCARVMAISNSAELYEKRVQAAMNSQENPKRIKPSEQYIFRRIVSRIGSGKILDVGCGTGNLLINLTSDTRELYGIDIVDELGGDKSSQFNFIKASATNLPFETGKFDYVICSEVLEHIDSDDAIKECFRVLKPGGIAIITVPNGKGISGDIPEHIRLFSFVQISLLLQQTGFEIIQSIKFGLPLLFINRLFSSLSMITQKTLPLSSPLNISVPEFLANNFYFECRKP